MCYMAKNWMHVNLFATVWFLVVAEFLAACNHSVAVPPEPVAPTPSPAYTVDPNPQPLLTTAIPLAAVYDSWQWVSVPYALCANGNATGFAVNLHANSNDLVIIYSGGGACWSAATCYWLSTAHYITADFNQNTFFLDPTQMPSLDHNFLLSNRQNPNNPFSSSNIAYFPYCTGDIHDGNNVVTYGGAPTATHHVGFRNAQLYTQILAAALPSTSHIWMTGLSAGGFGATLHYADTQLQFPNARLDLINDSGSSFPNNDTKPSWNVVMPAACTDCDPNNFETIVQFVTTGQPKSRFAFLSYSEDTVLPALFGISDTTFSSDLAAYRTFLDTRPNTKYFIVAGQGHVLLGDGELVSGGETLTSWLQQMISDDPNWRSMP